LFKHVTVRLIEHFGKQKNHLRLNLIDETGSTASAIGFFLNKENFPVLVEQDLPVVDLYATLELSRYGWKEELRLRIIDIK
jgi:hypothetical protein